MMRSCNYLHQIKNNLWDYILIVPLEYCNTDLTKPQNDNLHNLQMWAPNYKRWNSKLQCLTSLLNLSYLEFVKKKLLVYGFIISTGSPRLITDCLATIQSSNGPHPKLLITLFQSSQKKSSHNHMTAFWVLGNWLIFMASCGIQWSHDHVLWFVFTSFQVFLMISVKKNS